jgi:hypothetical protein
MANTTRPTRAGAWFEVHSVSGGPPRRGKFLEVRGHPGHEHYRVLGDEQTASIHFPAQGPREPRAVPRPGALSAVADEQSPVERG